MEQQTFIEGYSFVESPPQVGGRKYKTMIQICGLGEEGKTCKTCAHLLPCDYHEKRIYKCELWKLSRCAATDIRLKQQACAEYEQVAAWSQKVRWIE